MREYIGNRYIVQIKYIPETVIYQPSLFMRNSIQYIYMYTVSHDIIVVTKPRLTGDASCVSV